MSLFEGLTQRQIIQLLESNAIISEQQLLSEIINDIITTKEIRDGETRILEQRYIQSLGSLPIDEKTALAYEKPDSQSTINNQLRNAYDCFIVTEQNSYFMGKGIDYSIATEQYQENLSELLKSLKESQKDKKTALYASMMGSAGRIFWVNTQGKIDSKVLKPYEFCVVRDDVSKDNEVVYALIYTKITKIDLTSNGSEEKEIYRVEWYDSTRVQIFEQTDEDSEQYKFIEEKLHLFGRVPVIEFKNDEYNRGDSERVKSLIDAYNMQTSYDQDEVERFRQAYLAIIGAGLNTEDAQNIHKFKMIQIPDSSGDAKFLSKSINDTFHKNQREMLDENIFKFSQTVNFSDEKFSGASQSGESRRWKLMIMEQKRTEKEMFFTDALDEQFLLLSTSKTENLSFLADGVDYKYFQNIPVDTGYWADVIQKLRGNVPLKRIYELTPFVENPQLWEQELNEEINGNTPPETIV